MLWLLSVLGLTALVSWQGVGGPLIFDDYVNLSPIKQWLAGERSFSEVLLGNPSGPSGRPVSMATLMLNAAIGGTDGSSYKIGNILVHLLCGGLVFVLSRELLGLDPRNRERAALGALLVAAIWLLNPAQVSTILYAVQRMAQVSTLFVLLALIAFVRAAAQWESHPVRARWLLVLAFPLLVVIGAFGKENAVVALPMAMAIGAAFPDSAITRVRLLRLLFWSALAAGLLGFLYIVLAQPGFVVGGYAFREFSFEQRIYTQLVALVDYARSAFVPIGARSGLFADDYPISSGLLSPPATLMSLLLLIGASLGAWLLRAKAPLVLAGWWMFLAGHSVESSVWPLELYFEHRNYLPSVGLYLAAWGLLGLGLDALRVRAPHLIRLFWVILALYGALLVFATLQRAQAWGNELVMFAVNARERPDSYRANAGLWDVAIRNEQYGLARESVERMVQSERDRTRALGHVHRVVLDCMTKGAGAPADLDAAVAAIPSRLVFHDLYISKELVHTVLGRCAEPNAAQIGAALEAIRAKAGDKPPPWSPAPQFESLAAMAFWQAGEPERALALGASAWNSSGNMEAGLVYARLLAAAARFDEARAKVEAVSRSPGVAPDNPQVQAIREEVAELEARYQQIRQDAEGGSEAE